MNIVRFAHEDMAAFSEASHDRSALHMSADYARQTPYGRPLVFGVLELFAALNTFPDRVRQKLESVSVMYRQPLYLEVPYQIETAEPSPLKAKAALYDSGQIMMSSTFVFQESADIKEAPRSKGSRRSCSRRIGPRRSYGLVRRCPAATPPRRVRFAP